MDKFKTYDYAEVEALIEKACQETTDEMNELFIETNMVNIMYRFFVKIVLDKVKNKLIKKDEE
jgi:hypothetical protein